MIECDVLSPPRCSVALAYECDMAGVVEARAHLVRICGFAAANDIRLQLFALGTDAAALGELPGAPEVDLLTPALAPPDTDLAALEDDLTRAVDTFVAAAGQPPRGLRPQAMARNGIQKQVDLQELLLQQGFEFISSDYSTRHRAHAHDKAADDNAVRNMKHLQARRYPSGLWEIPATGYSDTDFLDELGGSRDDWIAHMKGCLEFACNLGGLVYAPRLSLSAQVQHDPDLRSLSEFVEYAAGLRESVAFVTYRDTHSLASVAVSL